MIKFEVGKRYYFTGYMSTMLGEYIERDTFGKTVFLNWHDKLYASDSRWWSK